MPSPRAAIPSPRPFEDVPPEVLGIACLDGRFFPHVARFLEGFAEGSGGRVDALFIPGGVGNLNPARVGAPSDLALDLSHVTTMVELHPIRRVILVGHADCGFYGLAMPDASPQERFEAQRHDLALFEAGLRARFPALDVQRWYAFAEGDEILFDRPEREGGAPGQP